MIVVIDYGMGNLRSVQKAFERLGLPAIITSDFDKIREASKIILPGVGHFAKGMQNLNSSGLSDLLKIEVLGKGKPILGICLGMQLMTKFSEEGNMEGLGLVDANTIRFPSLIKGYRIPHMGWNDIIRAKDSSITSNTDPLAQMYFVHSYYVKCNHETDVLFRTDYGIRFDSGFAVNNIFGFQFHPEKSYKPGLQLIADFAKL